MAYSKDMREAVVAAVGKGMTFLAVANSFSIGIDTVTRWMREYRKNGFCKGGYTVNRTFKKIDPEKLILRLNEKPDCTMVELAKEFNCSPVSLRTMAKKLGYVRKKNSSGIMKLTRNSAGYIWTR